MTGGQRTAHRLLWPVLLIGLLMAAGMAVALRPAPEPAEQTK